MSNDYWQAVQDMRDNWPYSGHCPECGHLRSHTIECSEAPHSYRMHLIENLQTRMRSMKSYALDMKKEVTFWQGKHAMLRHENNQMRKKLRQMEK